jgi:hypothetical protein
MVAREEPATASNEGWLGVQVGKEEGLFFLGQGSRNRAPLLFPLVRLRFCRSARASAGFRLFNLHPRPRVVF